MQLTVLQENLKRALAIVGRAVPHKSSLPILNNVLLSTEDGMLKLASTNLAIGITCLIGAEIKREGATTIPAKLLSDVVSSLPNAPIDLELLIDRAQTLSLTCARFETTIKGIEAEEYPAIPLVDQAPAITLPGAMLKGAIEQVSIAAATDDNRPVLAGICLRTTESGIDLMAADGFRLAHCQIGLAGPFTTSIDLIIPAASLIELARIIDTDADVAISIAPNAGLVSFANGAVSLNSRLIEGKFPLVDPFVRAEYTTRVLISTQEFARAVKLASHFSAAAANIIRLKASDATLILTANAAEVGSNHSMINAVIDGDSNNIALNVNLLADALSTIDTPQVAIELVNEERPAVIRPVGQDGLTQVVMPMTVRK